jgi:hypothetical protein
MQCARIVANEQCTLRKKGGRFSHGMNTSGHKSSTPLCDERLSLRRILDAPEDNRCGIPALNQQSPKLSKALPWPDFRRPFAARANSDQEPATLAGLKLRG